MIKKYINKIKYKLGIPVMYKSETSKVKHMVLPYCIGCGCDVGFGGDKIKNENCLGVDLPQPYAFTGKDKVDIACNIEKEEIDIASNSLDYLYSSHLIEDFENTVDILNKFIKVLKNNGTLILVFPDQQIYEKYCKASGQPLNIHHVHKHMGFEFMKQRLNELSNISYETLFENNCEIDYNVVMILKIKKQ